VDLLNMKRCIIRPDYTMKYTGLLFMAPVSAGFPSPADDYIEDKLDLNKYLVKHPAATFFVKVNGDSMIGAGIHHGDILIVDRSLEPVDKKVVIAVVDGELTVKRIRTGNGRVALVPENDAYQVLNIEDGMNFEIWGVVTSVIHSV
jgi:DNA polymerase V